MVVGRSCQTQEKLTPRKREAKWSFQIKSLGNATALSVSCATRWQLATAPRKAHVKHSSHIKRLLQPVDERLPSRKRRQTEEKLCVWISWNNFALIRSILTAQISLRVQHSLATLMNDTSAYLYCSWSSTLIITEIIALIAQHIFGITPAKLDCLIGLFLICNHMQLCLLQ